MSSSNPPSHPEPLQTQDADDMNRNADLEHENPENVGSTQVTAIGGTATVIRKRKRKAGGKGKDASAEAGNYTHVCLICHSIFHQDI